MASNYTQQYQLNQWSADDQVLRTEFNGDNARAEGKMNTKRLSVYTDDLDGVF